ncbi:MAG: hypothetical protein GY866_24275 [Proteobacteria bacterium]|nr:hypothetical protein [Pseudomonadota bacterium]
MKTKIATKNQPKDVTQQRIIQLCFDSNSIDNFSPGLKMIYALDDPPLFVMLEPVESDLAGANWT